MNGKWVNYDKSIINRNDGEYAGLGNPNILKEIKYS
jgi:hypothetical protein